MTPTKAKVLGIAIAILLVTVLIGTPIIDVKAYHNYSVKKTIKPLAACKPIKLANGTLVRASIYHETEGNVTAVKRKCL